MQPYPRAPDLVWQGHLHGTGCLSVKPMDTGFPTVVWRLCLGLGSAVTLPTLAGVLGGCAWVRVLVSSLHSWLGFVVCAVGLGFWLAPRHSWLGFSGRAMLCRRSACTLPFLVRVCGVGVCAWARASAVPRHSWLGCWGVCVCLCARSVCTPPLLAGVCGVGLCAWARVAAAPRHSWLGCWHVCVFVCALRLYSATPGWGVRCGCVCLGSGFGCALPLLAGLLGRLCVCVRAPLLPCHSWLGCAAWVCVFGLGFQLRSTTPDWGVGVCVCVCVRALFQPRHSWLRCAVWVCVLGLGFRLLAATPGWGVGLGVCLCARSASAPPLLAGLCGVVVCAWARVSTAPCHSWLGCCGGCVFVCALHFCPATPGWGVRHGAVCVWARVSAALRHS